MAEENNASVTVNKGNHNSSGRGRGGRGSNRGSRSQTFASSGRSNNTHPKQRHQGRGSGRGNGNHGRQPRQQTNDHQNRNNYRQKPRSYSHHDKDYKKIIEGPYAHLFCSERHGFALSRVLYPVEETALSSCYKDASSPKITSTQLEKWWECVKLVRCHVPYDETSDLQSTLDRCPICLDEDMISPHIAPCGHTFCLPCVLGYLNSVAKELNTESERLCKTKQKPVDGKAVVGNATKASVAVTTVRARCPMCSSGSSAELNAGDSMITYRDLRPVVLVPVSVVKAKSVGGGKNGQNRRCLGTKMKFVKLHRVLDSLAPYLPEMGHGVRGCVVSTGDQSLPDFPDGDDDVEECAYSRQYFVGCNEYGGALQRCLDGLNIYAEESGYCQVDTREKWNVSMAIEAIQASLRRWMGSGNDGGFRSMEIEAKANSAKEARLVRVQLDDTTKEKENAQQTNSALLSPGTAHLDRELNESLYFQACDGQLCFLSGINMACLLEEFSLHQNEHQIDESSHSRRAMPIPDSIEGTVVEVEPMIVTPELVKRKHFLSHLPLGSSVLFAEIDWYSGGANGNKSMLTKATLNKFRGDIQRRQSDRERAAKIEHKNDKQASKKCKEEELRRRKEAFGSSYLDGAPRQEIDPDDDFFKMPSPSFEEEQGTCNQRNATTAFKFSKVCSEMGAFPELAGSNSPKPPTLTNATVARSPPSLPSWGNNIGKQSAKPMKMSQTEAFPSLAAATQTAKNGDVSRVGKTCWKKYDK